MDAVYLTLIMVLYLLTQGLGLALARLGKPS